MEQKFQHARALRDDYGVTRPILVDALDGACHLEYGGNPNMTWIFNRAGTIHYKSDWTNADSVIDMVEYLLQVNARRRDGARLAPFSVQRLEYREIDDEAFFDGLRRSGQQAVDDFVRTFPERAKFAKESNQS